MLAAPYLVPALTLRDAIHSEVFTSEQFDPRNWSPWSFAPRNAVRFQTFALIALGWSGLALGALRRGPAWSAIGILAAGCSLALVPQLWALPVLHEVQFPWRLLGVVEFAAITAFALRPPRWTVTAAGLAVLAAACLQGIDYRGRALPAKIDEVMMDAVEYLPSGLQTGKLVTGLDPDLSSLRVPLVQGPASIGAVQPDGRVTLVVTAPGRVTFRRSNFPAWRVRDASGEVPLEPGPLISFQAAPGVYEIVKAPLPAEQLGAGLALVAALGLAFWPGRRLRGGGREGSAQPSASPAPG
jgi:hypothetical protein